MRKAYQKEWHNITFDSFAEVSSSKIADATFYTLFYKAFFQKYNNWDELNSSWITDKISLVNFLIDAGNLHKGSKILSIGCGIGIMEKELIDQGYNIEVTEVSQGPLVWLKKYLPDSRIHIGFFPACLPYGCCYDLIYLSAIDYVFNNNDLIKLLISVSERLSHGGKCLLFSVSFDYKANMLNNLLSTSKSIANYFLYKMGLKKQGQFWGYIRSDSEFRSIMQKSGFTNIIDGLVDYRTRSNYWIEGIKA